jgi:integral membrane sensor domain MASE1
MLLSLVKARRGHRTGDEVRLASSLGRAALVCVAYFAAGKLGLSLAFLNASASPVWPPTGIALACVLLWGHRVWPAVLLGAFLGGSRAGFARATFWPASGATSS